MSNPASTEAGAPSTVPARAPIVLVALILVAAVANLNLAVANVALPDIGKAFDSSQTTLDLIAVGYSLGLAASVLYLGALGDRYGRKTMLLLGVSLSVPACLLAAYAPNDSVLIAARLLGGIAFVIRQRRTKFPLYDLDVAGRRVFWVAACAGIIVFGSLMGAMFIGQQFLQNVLGYTTLQAGAAILPAAVCMVLIAPRSAKL